MSCLVAISRGFAFILLAFLTAFTAASVLGAEPEKTVLKTDSNEDTVDTNRPFSPSVKNSPATNRSIFSAIDEDDRARYVLQYEKEKKKNPDFMVESVDEFIRITRYYERLLADGRVTHAFRLANGQLIQCIEVGTQESVSRSGLPPRAIRTGPEILPGTAEEGGGAGRTNSAGFGMDGSLDQDGNVRSCPKGSIPKAVPSLRDLYKYRKLDDVFQK